MAGGQAVTRKLTKKPDDMIAIKKLPETLTMSAKRETVAICVATWQRPGLLAQCLAAIDRLSLPGDYAFILIVADNDSGQSARAIVAGFSARARLATRYVCEPERGLARVRNRLLQAALAEAADFICFIDDDEFPQPDWLAKHLAAIQQYQAEVVTGPVFPFHGDDPAAATPVKSKRRTGQTPPHVASNNVVFKSLLIKEQGLRFDRRYDFIGGEDHDFFERSARHGNRHVWVAEAVVFETVPAERRTWRYLVYRHFTSANNNVVKYRARHGRLYCWCYFMLKGAGKLPGGLVQLTLAGLLLNRERARKGLAKIAAATGYVSGLLNIIVERYR